MGQESHRFAIANITSAKPCVITTEEEHGFTTGDFVRLTDLNGSIPEPRGMNPINNYRYKIVVTSTTDFYIKDPITDKVVDSTNFTPYVDGGSCNLVETNFEYSAE